MPGSHIDIIERIENQSGRKLNNGFGLVYIPDLVALGSVIKDFENPDLIIMGESDEKYGTIAHDIYSTILKNNPPVVRMSLIESEITKVSLNAYITMKISFANFIGNVFIIIIQFTQGLLDCNLFFPESLITNIFIFSNLFFRFNGNNFLIASCSACIPGCTPSESPILLTP